MLTLYRQRARACHWEIFVISWALVLIPAQLCRHYRDFWSPLSEIGLAIRRFWGQAAPLYEHFAFGLGMSLGIATVIWFGLYVIVPDHLNKPERHGVWGTISAWAATPTLRRDLLLLLFVPSMPPISWSWTWERCQALTPDICRGGSGNGTLQYDQILFDHLGVACYLVGIIGVVLIERRLRTAPYEIAFGVPSA